MMAASVAAASVTTTAAVSGKGMFSATFVRSLTHVAPAVARFICREVIEALRTTLRNRSVVAVSGIVTIVYVTIEMVMTVEPGTRADEDSARKPVRAVVPVGSAVIRRIVEVAVRANRSDTYVDGNLGRTHRGTTQECKGKHWNCKELT